MEIRIKWHGDQFNVELASGPDKDEFLSVKGCRLKEYEGKQFVATPATKSEKTGKWWNHAWFSDAFQSQVIKLAQESQPRSEPSGGGIDPDDSIPF